MRSNRSAGRISDVRLESIPMLTATTIPGSGDRPSARSRSVPFACFRASESRWKRQVRSSQASADSFDGSCIGALPGRSRVPLDRLVGEEMTGISQHYLGDQASAWRHFECVLAYDITPVQRWSHITRFEIGLRATMRVFLAWVRWQQGFQDQAMRAAESSIADAWLAITQSRCVTLWRRRHVRSPIGRRSGHGGAVRGDAARAFDKICAGTLA